MPDVLVDSTVLLDVLTEDDEWLDWSAAALARAADQGRLVLNPLVYAEVSLAFDRIEDLDAVLDGAAFERRPLPWTAASGCRCRISTSARTRRSTAWRFSPATRVDIGPTFRGCASSLRRLQRSGRVKT
jgi:predicted nucleic acid-binding protein